MPVPVNDEATEETDEICRYGASAGEAPVPTEDGDNGARSLSPANWEFTGDEAETPEGLEIDSFTWGTLLVLLGEIGDIPVEIPGA